MTVRDWTDERLPVEGDVVGDGGEAIYDPDWNGSSHEGPIYE